MVSVACTRAFGRGRRGYFRLGFKGQRVGAFRMSHGIMPLFPHKILGAFSCRHEMEAETSRIGRGFKLCENFCIILLKMGRSRRKFFNLRYVKECCKRNILRFASRYGIKRCPLIRNRRAGRRRLGLPPRRKRFSAGSAWRTCGIRPGISGTILFNMSYAGPFLCFSAGVLRIPYFKDKEQAQDRATCHNLPSGKVFPVSDCLVGSGEDGAYCYLVSYRAGC